MSPAFSRVCPLVLVALVTVVLAENDEAAAAPQDGRRLAIVIDTSGSMTSSDRPRYTVLLAQMISDLLAPSDHLSVIRLPRQPESCNAGPNRALSVTLDPTSRPHFKSSVDSLIRYGGDNIFASPLRTAMDALGGNPMLARMLLIIADSGGLEECTPQLSRALGDFRRTGATVAAINLGGTAGAFDNDPAFEFTTAAPDAERLLQSVALVYQRFLGSSQVQTGRALASFKVDVHPHVSEAFVVAATDGDMKPLLSDTHNPAAKAIEPDLHGGGSTRGLDGVIRSYRILRLDQPAAGPWVFHAEALGASAGYMFFEASSLSVRRVDNGTVPVGRAAPVTFEIYDTIDGRSLRTKADLNGIELRVGDGPAAVSVRDDGKDGDARPGDGLFTLSYTAGAAGKNPLEVRIVGNGLNRRVPVEVEAIISDWLLRPNLPAKVEVGESVTAMVGIAPTSPARLSQDRPLLLVLHDGAQNVELHDDGKGGDQYAGDGVYSGAWTPNRIGQIPIQISAHGGGTIAPATVLVQVRGVLRFGPIPRIAIGPAQAGQEVEAQLDLSNATARGPHDLQVSTGFSSGGAALELKTAAGWKLLSASPVPIRIEPEQLKYPLRLRVGSCPSACFGESPTLIVVRSQDADDKPIEATAALAVSVVPEPWLKCWWWALALSLGAICLAVFVYGYWSPTRFPPRLGVVISPEADLQEGYCHSIRAARGSGVGFYRNARVFVRADFRLSGRSRNAIAELRAHPGCIRIRPVAGTGLQWQAEDGEWRDVPNEEMMIRFGQVFRTSTQGLYFEVRNASKM